MDVSFNKRAYSVLKGCNASGCSGAVVITYLVCHLRKKIPEEKNTDLLIIATLELVRFQFGELTSYQVKIASEPIPVTLSSCHKDGTHLFFLVGLLSVYTILCLLTPRLVCMGEDHILTTRRRSLCHRKDHLLVAHKTTIQKKLRSLVSLDVYCICLSRESSGSLLTFGKNKKHSR